MDAPVYPPAKQFVAPARVATTLNTRDTAIADLMANPAAWAIVQKDQPGLEGVLGSSMLKPHLGNFSFRSLVQFGAVQDVALDRIDEQLKALGALK